MNRNKKKHRIILPALLRVKERHCSRRLLRKSKLQHLRVACVRAALLTSWPRCRFSLGWSSLGGCRRAPTATGRMRTGLLSSTVPSTAGQRSAPLLGAAVVSASRRGSMCWIASVCCCTSENCWAKPSTVSPNSPAWERRGSVPCRRPSSLPG